MSTADLSTTFDLCTSTLPSSPASLGCMPVLDFSTWPWGLCSLFLVLLSFKVDQAGLGSVILLILVLYWLTGSSKVFAFHPRISPDRLVLTVTPSLSWVITQDSLARYTTWILLTDTSGLEYNVPVSVFVLPPKILQLE